MSARSRWPGLALLGVAIVLGLFSVRHWLPGTASAPAPAPAPAGSALVAKALPSLERAGSWVGARTGVDSLLGNVVAVVFWSTTQPASLRALHDVQAWHDAYARYGLRVIGVHVPEFAFAADSAHVASMARRLHLTFPIALDPSLELWSGFAGRGGRPRFVVADPAGRVVADREGASAIPEVENEVRAAIAAARPEARFPSASAAPVASAAGSRFPAPVHLGRARVRGGPLASAVPGRPLTYTAQLRYQVEGEPYTPYPVGRWTLGGDGITAARGGAENFVALRYDAASLGAVLGPPERGPTRVWVLRDENWLPSEALGADAQLDGRGASFVLVTEPRLYSVCRGGQGEHVVKLSPEDPGTRFYAFSFEPHEPAGP